MPTIAVTKGAAGVCNAYEAGLLHGIALEQAPGQGCLPCSQAVRKPKGSSVGSPYWCFRAKFVSSRLELANRRRWGLSVLRNAVTTKPTQHDKRKDPARTLQRLAAPFFHSQAHAGSKPGTSLPSASRCPKISLKRRLRAGSATQTRKKLG